MTVALSIYKAMNSPIFLSPIRKRRKEGTIHRPGRISSIEERQLVFRLALKKSQLCRKRVINSMHFLICR